MTQDGLVCVGDFSKFYITQHSDLDTQVLNLDSDLHGTSLVSFSDKEYYLTLSLYVIDLKGLTSTQVLYYWDEIQKNENDEIDSLLKSDDEDMDETGDIQKLLLADVSDDDTDEEDGNTEGAFNKIFVEKARNRDDDPDESTTDMAIKIVMDLGGSNCHPAFQERLPWLLTFYFLIFWV